MFEQNMYPMNDNSIGAKGAHHVTFVCLCAFYTNFQLFSRLGRQTRSEVRLGVNFDARDLRIFPSRHNI